MAFTTGNYNAPIINCGVYFEDGLVANRSGSYIRAIPCSITSLSSKVGMDNSLDSVILYPGFKVELYNNNDYSSLFQTIDNSFNDKIILKMATSRNTCSSCKVFYQNNEIVINGLSNNTAVTTILKNKTVTFTGSTSVVT